MYGKGTLAATGAAVTIAGFDVSLSMVALGVVLMVISGALIFRAAKRKQRYDATGGQNSQSSSNIQAPGQGEPYVR
jgi:glucose uptake protein GlcU